MSVIWVSVWGDIGGRLILLGLNWFNWYGMGV